MTSCQKGMKIQGVIGDPFALNRIKHTALKPANCVRMLATSRRKHAIHVKFSHKSGRSRSVDAKLKSDLRKQKSIPPGHLSSGTIRQIKHATF
jgi:hypothetical protein